MKNRENPGFSVDVFGGNISISFLRQLVLAGVLLAAPGCRDEAVFAELTATRARPEACQAENTKLTARLAGREKSPVDLARAEDRAEDEAKAARENEAALKAIERARRGAVARKAAAEKAKKDKAPAPATPTPSTSTSNPGSDVRGIRNNLTGRDNYQNSEDFNSEGGVF